ncbi:hypothetical protein KO505_05140 [Psychrosphaera sp. F3M07]|jgi:hypothetical protein|uniref:Uncharacterized protein n=1 Tax=Psychrosphaera aquimarina TaxID=2044854 RepID=A0ABU3QZ43_9GAMM|nr:MULTISPECIES: hypothetical protein [Psychrosphaera]MBU2917351.1 hypothetical protein [Psychrosphaera sp. F3M07]MDU0112698.1 hypothetical protein [Psychrosphaera aquimarina]
MRDDLKGLCLFLGMLSLGYVALLLAVAIFTGAKIYKGIFLIGLIAASLITLGLNKQVKNRIIDFTKSLAVR